MTHAAPGLAAPIQTEVVVDGPFSAALLFWRARRGEMRCSIIAKTTYALGPRVAALVEPPDALRPVDVPWYGAEEKSIRTPSDLVPFKHSPEVMLVGHAYAPGKKPQRRLAVRLIVGDLDSALEVFPPRRFLQDGTLEEPLAARMPLAYEYAAGGEDTDNPAGVDMGFTDTWGKRGAPSVLFLGAPLSHPDDHVDTAGWGPIAPGWPSRSRRLRAEDRTWLADLTRTPMPSSFDTQFFQSAPHAHWLSGPIRPDERLVLENLSPAHERLVTNLEPIVPQATVLSSKELRVPLIADTLFIDTDRALITLTWRGLVLVDERAPSLMVLVASASSRPSMLPQQPSAEERAALLAEIETTRAEMVPDNAARTMPFPAASRSARGPTPDYDDDALPFRTPDADLSRTQPRTAYRETPVPPEPAPVPPRVAAPPEPVRAPPDPPPPPPPRQSFPSSAGFAPVPVPPAPVSARGSVPGGAPPVLSSSSGTAAGFSPPGSSAPSFSSSTSGGAPSSPSFSSPGGAPSGFSPSSPASPSFSSPGGAPSGFSPSSPSSPSFSSPGGAPSGFSPSSPASPSFSSPGGVSAGFSSSGGASAGFSPAAPAPAAAPVPPPPVRTGGASWAPPIEPRGRAQGAPGASATEGPAAGAGWISVQSASDAAVEREPGTGKAADRRRDAGREGAGEARRHAFVDLLAFDPALPARLRRTPVFAKILAAQGERPAWVRPDEPVDERSREDRERMDVLRVLSFGAPCDLPRVRELLDDAFDDATQLELPLVVVNGQLRPSHDDLAVLRATARAGQPLALTNKALQAALKVLDEAVEGGVPPSGEAMVALLRQAEQAAGSMWSYLHGQVQRMILEERQFKRRTVLGEQRIRAELSTPSGETVPAYVPGSVAPSLPMLATFPVVVLGELRPREDAQETHAEAFQVWALGRVVRQAGGRAGRS